MNDFLISINYQVDSRRNTKPGQNSSRKIIGKKSLKNYFFKKVPTLLLFSFKLFMKSSNHKRKMERFELRKT